MVNIRINNDVPIKWHIKHNGEDAILQGKELELKVCNTFGCTAITDYIIDGSELSFVFSGSAQKYLGDYHLTLKIKDGNNVYTVDACKAFRLVSLSCEVEDNAIVEVESNITVPRNGFSAYELAVLNGEYTGDYDGYQRWLARYAENTANEAVNIANEANSKADGANENSKQAVALSKSANENSSKALTLSQQASEKSTNAEDKASNAETLAKNAAQQEGTYPNLTSGFSDNLVGRGEATPEVFTFRQSGGNTSINDGTARLKSIKGNSVVFNQLASPYEGGVKVEKTNNGRTLLCTPTGTPTTPGSGNYSSGWVHPARYIFVPERYYLFSFEYKRISKRTDIDDFIPKETFRIAINGEGIFIPINIGEAKHIECILKCPSDDTTAFISLHDCIVEINDLQVFDLTAMFGAGNEPQLVEEFKALYPNDYYEYNTCEIINSNYTAIESVGFNAFDGEKAEVIGGKVYELLGNYTSIGFTSVIGGELTTIEIPEDKHYTPSQNGYIYAVGSDVCIHLCHTGYKDGKYEPYRKDVINLPNIELKKAGNVYDEIRYNPNSEKWEYVQRVGSVDMGGLNWVYYTNPNTTAYPYGYLAALVAGRQKGIYNILCSRYTYSGGLTVDNNIFGNSASEGVYVIDSNYTDGQVFKEAMKGQILQYELAEPIITELEGDYSTDYIVSDFGTEKAITDKLCAPFRADIIYQFNAVDRIRENSAKIAQLEALIVELNNKLLAQEAESVNNINLEEE